MTIKSVTRLDYLAQRVGGGKHGASAISFDFEILTLSCRFTIWRALFYMRWKFRHYRS